jgi:hypothetical protein
VICQAVKTRASSAVGLVLCLSCGDDFAAPPASVAGTYDMVQQSIGGTCAFEEDPLSTVLDVLQNGDELTLTVIVPGTGQAFEYIGVIERDGDFRAMLTQLPPGLTFSAESTVEGMFTGPIVMATERFEIRDAGEFGLPDCTDIARWEGTRR